MDPRSAARAVSPDDMAAVRRWARLLDSQFRIPGTNIRFGWDPLLGLVPGLGDLVGPVFAAIVLVHAWKLGVPKIVMARMILNAGIDAVLGAFPVVGDAVDVFWKANQANVQLLERHSQPGTTIRPVDRVFVAGALALLGAVVLGAVLLAILIVVWIGRSLV
jgi:hypothetical protein